MEHTLSAVPRYLPPLLLPLRQTGGNDMERLTKRVERLEQDTGQIKTDLAVLTERSKNFATKTDVDALRTDQFKLRCEMLAGFARIEKQTAAQFARIDEKLARADAWTLQANGNFATISEQFKRIDEQFERIDERFERMDERFERIDERFERMDERFERIDERFERMDTKFERIDEKFDRLNDRITWTLLIPAVLAVLGWVAKEVLIKA